MVGGLPIRPAHQAHALPYRCLERPGDARTAGVPAADAHHDGHHRCETDPTQEPQRGMQEPGSERLCGTRAKAASSYAGKAPDRRIRLICRLWWSKGRVRNRRVCSTFIGPPIGCLNIVSLGIDAGVESR